MKVSELLAISLCILAACAIWGVFFIPLSYCVGKDAGRAGYRYDNDFWPFWSWFYDLGYRQGEKGDKPARKEINKVKYGRSEDA